MSQVLDFDLSGIAIRLADVPVASAERLSAEWAVYASDRVSSPFLEIEIRPDRIEPSISAFEPKAMLSRFSGAEALFELPEGRARVHRDGRATVDLARDLGGREFYTLTNLVRASLAWALPSRGAALLHAAGLVLDGRGFVLAGAESSGKSTWARLGEERGGIVVSDDLVLLDATRDGSRAPRRTLPVHAQDVVPQGALAAGLHPVSRARPVAGDLARCADRGQGPHRRQPDLRRRCDPVGRPRSRVDRGPGHTDAVRPVDLRPRPRVRRHAAGLARTCLRDRVSP